MWVTYGWSVTNEGDLYSETFIQKARRIVESGSFSAVCISLLIKPVLIQVFFLRPKIILKWRYVPITTRYDGLECFWKVCFFPSDRWILRHFLSRHSDFDRSGTERVWKTVFCVQSDKSEILYYYWLRWIGIKGNVDIKQDRSERIGILIYFYSIAFILKLIMRFLWIYSVIWVLKRK